MSSSENDDPSPVRKKIGPLEEAENESESNILPPQKDEKPPDIQQAQQLEVEPEVTRQISTESEVELDDASHDEADEEETAVEPEEKSDKPAIDPNKLSPLPEEEEKAKATVEKAINQRRPSTLTVFGALVQQMFMEKKIKEDGIPAEIIEGMYLGSIGAAKNINHLLEIGITHILCVANQLKPSFPNKFTYKTIELLDAPNSPIQDHFEDTFNFIDDCIGNGGKCLVHCFAGMSRSVTVVSAYLMRKLRMTAVDSLQLVKEKREVANPNPGFIVQLIKYQATLKIPYKKVRGSSADEVEAKPAQRRRPAKRRNLSSSSTDSNGMVSDSAPEDSSSDEDDKDKPPRGYDRLTLDLKGDDDAPRRDTSTPSKVKRISINAPGLRAMDRGKRPSLLTALDKLRGLRASAHQRRSSGSVGASEEHDTPTASPPRTPVTPLSPRLPLLEEDKTHIATHTDLDAHIAASSFPETEDQGVTTQSTIIITPSPRGRANTLEVPGANGNATVDSGNTVVNAIEPIAVVSSSPRQLMSSKTPVTADEGAQDDE